MTQVAPVSAVIPCFNCVSTLRRAVSSVARQTLRPGELILVDDASTDSTDRVIAELQKEYGANWLRSIRLPHNAGPATARNKGWNAAGFPFVAFLDADDAWMPEKLEQQLRYMQSGTGADLTAHGCHMVGSSEGDNLRPQNGKPIVLTRGALLISNRIATRTVMLKREIPYRFKDGKRYAEDYLLWLQMACDGRRLTLLDEDLCTVFKREFGEGGLSAQLWRMEKGELAVFWQLVRERRLAIPAAMACSAFSLIKYVRRVAVVVVRQIGRKRGAD